MPKIHVRDVPHDLLVTMSEEQLAMLDWEMSETEFEQILPDSFKGATVFDVINLQWRLCEANEKLSIPRHV